MNFDELIHFLEKRLKKEMPGSIAHNRMKPKMPNGAPLRIKHATSPREGGVLILFFEEDGEVKFPLIQRPTYKGVHSGQMALPGGRRELEDSGLIATALRETEEEIGVSRNAIQVIGTLSKFFVAASNYDVLPVIGKVNERPHFTPDPREVHDIVTPSVSHLIAEDRLKEKEITAGSGMQLMSPYFDLENRTVWGATAMMLSELVTILEDFKL